MRAVQAIDIHTHIIPAVDDGVQTEDEAVEFARVAVVILGRAVLLAILVGDFGNQYLNRFVSFPANGPLSGGPVSQGSTFILGVFIMDFFRH